MPAALRRFTVDEVEAFPHDGNRYEVLHGVLLVTPQAGLPHQRVAARLATALGSFVQAEPEVELWSPGVVRVRPSIHLEPDILIGRSPEVLEWEAVREHWLAVEVSGVGSRVHDREYKRDAYLDLGVKEVWLVDLDLQQIFVSRPGGPKDLPHDAALTWRSPGGRELRLDIPALFRGIPRGAE
jgi:Uma2 family endonuclease